MNYIIQETNLKEVEKLSMEDVKKSLIKKDCQATIRLSIVLTTLLVLLEIGLIFWNKAFIILIWIPLLPLINIIKRKIFFKNAEFCYGKVIDVTLNVNDDVYMYTKIEFMDRHSKKKYQTEIDEHWGDFRDEDKDKINEFYEEGKKRIGKKVPLFYKKKNPNKNKIFINNLKD